MAFERADPVDAAPPCHRSVPRRACVQSESRDRSKTRDHDRSGSRSISARGVPPIAMWTSVCLEHRGRGRRRSTPRQSARARPSTDRDDGHEQFVQVIAVLHEVIGLPEPPEEISAEVVRRMQERYTSEPQSCRRPMIAMRRSAGAVAARDRVVLQPVESSELVLDPTGLSTSSRRPSPRRRCRR